jgi:hypothetical protein
MLSITLRKRILSISSTNKDKEKVTKKSIEYVLGARGKYQGSTRHEIHTPQEPSGGSENPYLK